MKIKYEGIPYELTLIEEEKIDGVSSFTQLKELMTKRDDAFRKLFSDNMMNKICVSRNGVMLHDFQDVKFENNDEVILFSPLTGG